MTAWFSRLIPTRRMPPPPRREPVSAIATAVEAPPKLHADRLMGGQSSTDLARSAVILVGVSRSGKTPTSLYLALQFGVRAANYPLIPEDFQRGKLPEALRAQKTRLYGLTIAPERLHEIRKERRPGSRYAELDNCRFEVEEAEAMMRREGIRSINSTSKSIEEIATTILRELRIKRQVY